MCFSAEASFAASGVLAASSVAISRVPKEKSSVPLALIPTIFAAHQFIEGVLWLHHDGVLPDAYKQGAVYAYVFIAYILWPAFIPFAVYLTEPGRRRRAVILLCQAAGLGVGLSLMLANLGTPPDVFANCCSLSYQVNAPDMMMGPYLFAVAVPFLVSSRKGMVLFGVAVAVSCAVAAYMATAATFPSVWCFFAAVLSGGLHLHFYLEARAVTGRASMNASRGALAG